MRITTKNNDHKGGELMRPGSRACTGQDRAIGATIEGGTCAGGTRDTRVLPVSKIDSELIASDTTKLVQRAADASMEHIDRLIEEVQRLRKTLREQSVRVQRELAEYARISQLALDTTNIIAESLSLEKGQRLVAAHRAVLIARLYERLNLS